jgi:hypothetical protein
VIGPDDYGESNYDAAKALIIAAGYMADEPVEHREFVLHMAEIQMRMAQWKADVQFLMVRRNVSKPTITRTP